MKIIPVLISAIERRSATTIKLHQLKVCRSATAPNLRRLKVPCSAAAGFQPE